MKKKLLPVIWIVSTLILGVLASLYSGESSHFFGIADDQEETISFESPVEIVQTLVVEGEQVKHGDLLVEVNRESLKSNLAIIDYELQELKSRKKEDNATLHSSLISLEAKQRAQQTDIDRQIKILQSRYALNANYLNKNSELNSEYERASIHSNQSQIRNEIKSLKTQRSHLIEATQAEIDNIQLQLDTNDRPIDAKIAGLEEEKIELVRQKSRLHIRADFNGRVGSLLFKAGETVPPYTPILTMHSSRPSYVKGYINENVVNKVSLGQKVWVQSSTSQTNEVNIIGIVESLGSRIVEYPERLKKNKFVSAWGREVIVQLEQSHSLLLGEKVIVKLNEPNSILANFLSVTDLIANANGKETEDTNYKKIPFYTINDTSLIKSISENINANDVEASGIIKNMTDTGYLMVGDEGKGDDTDLYNVNSKGKIVDRLIINSHKKKKKNKMPRIDDLESISSDGKYIYISSSLSRNKDDELNPQRRKLVRLESAEDELIFRGSIDLYSYLKKLSESTKDSKTKRFLHKAISSHDIEIEAHSVTDGNLYLGFKAPLNKKKETVILLIKDIDSVFSNKKPNGKIWQTFDLHDPSSGKATLLTDMSFQGDQLFLLSVNSRKSRSISHLWLFDIKTETLLDLAVFHNLKAEGISQSVHNPSEHILVFDSGSKTPPRQLSLNTQLLATARSM